MARDLRTLECVNSVFEQPWWLDAVAPGQWSDIVIRRKGEIIARMPFTRRRRAGLDIVNMPPLTQTAGPWLKLSGEKYTSRLSEQHELLEQVIAMLPAADLISLWLAPSCLNFLPFHWHGFDVTCFCTYRLEDLSDLDRIWQEASESCRRAIRKARKQVRVRDAISSEEFWHTVAKTWSRQGMQLPISFDVFSRLQKTCSDRGAGRMFIAEDAQSNVHAALYLVWDSNAAYYLIGGGDSSLRASGAQSLLMWEAIRHSSTVTRAFDFEGSINRNIECFFRGFGAVQTLYLNVRRASRRLRMLTAAKNLFATMSGINVKWFY